MISIGQHLTVLPLVDSTNNYAMALARQGMAKHGDAFFALEQSHGRGQRNRIWETQPGTNIMLSAVLQPLSLQVSQQFQLSAAVALGCYDFFSSMAGTETSIKWPNDIYWRDRKAGGILIENLIAGNSWQLAVVGIGININQTKFPEGLRNPVSLKQITGREWDIIALAKELCACLQKRYEQLQKPSHLQEDYNAVLYKRHLMVRLKKDNRVFDATVKEVTASGQLIVTTSIEEQFDFGEVEWIIPGTI